MPEMSGPSLVIAFRPEVNGYATVDLQSQRWPDHMGDPKGEPMLFGAWTMGHFGPFTFPGNLERAVQQAWGWKEGAGSAVAQHQAFLRIRMSYVFGGGPDTPVMPKDCEPKAELEFVTKLALALSSRPAALAYFNPNGEVLRSADDVRKSVDHAAKHQIPPLDNWSNVRLFNPNNGWLLMDTIGMEQLDVPDGEACFRAKAYEPADIANFLRNASLYLLTNGEVIKNGDTMNGPGGVNWRAFHVKEPLCAPPRRVLRWFPMDGSTPPREMAPAGIEQTPEKRSFGQRIARLFGR